MSQVVPVLRAVRERLADPRRWVQGFWAAYRDDRGVVYPHAGSSIGKHHASNCWCLGQALSNAIMAEMHSAGRQTTAADVSTFTERRSDVERELLVTLEREGVAVAAVYLWNDDKKTSHADVLGLIDKTLARLEAA